MTPAGLAAVINGARCFQSCIPMGMMWPVANYLLLLINRGEAPPASVNELVKAASCFASCVPPGMQGVMTILLLTALSGEFGKTYLDTEGGERLVGEDGNPIII